MFNYKDFTYLRVAVLSHIDKLSAINEDDPGVTDDNFSDIQDDIQYLRRLRDMIDREIATIQSPSVMQVTRLSVASSDGQPE
jgi:hypothetical protein